MKKNLKLKKRNRRKKTKSLYFIKLENNYDIIFSQWVNDDWDMFVSAGYMHKHGRSLGSHNHTHMIYFPFTAGMRYYMPVWSDLDYYVGAAVLVGYVRMHDRSRYFRRQKSSKGAGGGGATTGFRWNFTRDFFVDIFGDYQYQKFCFEHARHNIKRHDLNMSGFRAGIGIGFVM